MKTLKIPVYKFAELSEEAQQKALSDNISINLMGNWWEHLEEDAKNIGFEFGEDADFIGTAKDTAYLIIENHGKDTDTYKSAKTFLKKWEDSTDAEREDYTDDFKIDLQRHYHKMNDDLEADLCSDEQIKSTIEANEYDFTIDGKMVGFAKYASDEQEDENFYFLFGEDISDLYHNASFDEVLDQAKKTGDFDTYNWSRTEDPSNLLVAADGWMGAATITKEEYDQLNAIKNKKER